MESQIFQLVAIKGRFYAPRDRYYALFLIVLNEVMNCVESAAIVVSVYSELFQTELSHSWRTFESKINELKYRNQYAPIVTHDLQDRLKELMLGPGFYEELMKAARANATKQLAKIFHMIFMRSLKDSDLEIETAVEWIKEKDFEAPQEQEPSSPQSKVENVAESSPAGITLPVSLVLDPIGGKAVTELKPKDRIMVRIIPQGERANYFIDLMRLRGEKNILPCPMTIESIKADALGLVIRGKIDENLYGEATETEKVLVQIAAEKTVEEPQKVAKAIPKDPTKMVKEESEKNKNPMLVILAVSVLLLGLLVYLLITL
ncbi:MAG: hypothetical protein NZM25_10755 [Leptospiraceae bacterium]|nr:hypothetical protein [Leptospiraceae bacterium]MDW8305908.1 hypothetical protein [Leptospiraceae bacterium]